MIQDWDQIGLKFKNSVVYVFNIDFNQFSPQTFVGVG